MSSYAIDNYDNSKGILKKSVYKIISYVDGFIDALSNTEECNIIIPRSIYIRSKLICEYMSEELDLNININDFIYILYEDCILKLIKKYDPNLILDMLRLNNKQQDTLIIIIDSEVSEVPKKKTSNINITITFDKKELTKGKYIIDEFNDIHDTNITVEEFISGLWINFVEKYKSDKKGIILNEFIKILRARR